MTLHYGSLFSDRWAQVSAEDMQSHWLAELGPFNGDAIGQALKALDSHPLPPSLPEFKALCKAFYKPAEAPMLEHAKATPEEARENREKVRVIVGGLGKPKDYRQWARNIVQLWDEGKYPSLVGYELACAAVGITPKPKPIFSKKDRAYAD